MIKSHSRLTSKFKTGQKRKKHKITNVRPSLRSIPRELRAELAAKSLMFFGSKSRYRKVFSEYSWTVDQYSAKLDELLSERERVINELREKHSILPSGRGRKVRQKQSQTPSDPLGGPGGGGKGVDDRGDKV